MSLALHGFGSTVTQVLDGYIGGPIKEYINTELANIIELAKMFMAGCTPLPPAAKPLSCTSNNSDPLQHWLQVPCTAPHRTAPHLTALHRTSPHRTALNHTAHRRCMSASPSRSSLSTQPA